MRRFILTKAPNICELVGRDKRHLVQLCLPIEKLKGTIKFPVVASEKLDGVFCFAYVSNNDCYIYSRTGEEYTSLRHLRPELIKVAKETQCEIIIFEAYTEGVPQPTISGWCRDTKRQHTEIEAYVHDALMFTEFYTCDTDSGYADRYDYLRFIFNCVSDLKYVHLVEQRLLNSKTALMQMAEEIWSRGGEGVVYREFFAGYMPGKRNSTMVKIKKGVSYDLKVAAVEEGKGKYVGCVGKLICHDRNGKVVKVGSGLTDEQRKTWWSPWGYDEVVGKIVQIDAMAVSSKGVLREPRFKGIRHDKMEVDVIC
jgi:DNA ligase-1